MDLKRLYPHIIAIVIFLAVSLLYFFPVIEGKQIVQHDIAQWEGMSKEIQDFRNEFHEEPLWTRSMFGGMPAYQISVIYGANLLQYVNSALTLGLPTPVNFIFLALLGFYILFSTLKIDFRIAIAGAFAFAFSSYNMIIIMAGHNSKMHAIALIPFVLTGILLCLRGRYLLGTVLTALFLGLEIYANHLQITYYLAMLIGILMLTELGFAIKEKSIPEFVKKSTFLLIAVIFAILPNITSLWATYEYGKYSTRGPSELTEKMESTGLDKDYALGWSYGVKESLTLLIPNFMGGPTQTELSKNSNTYKALVANGAGAQANQFIKQVPLYWGDQPFTSGPNYAGSIVIFLFVLSLFVLKGKWKWWIVISSVLFLMLSWGKNFLPLTDLFFYNFPGYNKFRAVSMILSMMAFTLPFLGILGLSKIRDLNPKEIKQGILYSFYITGGFTLLVAIFPVLSGGFSGIVDENLSGYPSWLLEAIKSDRSDVLRMDAFRSFAFIAISFGLLYYHFVKNKLSTSIVFPVLALFILIDLWSVDKRYLGEDEFKSKKGTQVFQPSEVDQRIMSDPELGYRVMNAAVSTFNDASTSYFHNSIGGYHGAKLKRYQELIEYQISKNNMSVLDMLNTKYFILPKQDGAGVELQINPGACGPAWFVKEIKYVDNADQELEALTDFTPLQTAIIDSRFKSDIQIKSLVFDTTASIKLVEYKPNYLKYESVGLSDQMAVFSEIYYEKGWNAYIDGSSVGHFRVDYVLRGMVVPSGRHIIEYKFEPKVFATGEKISLTGSLIVILFTVFAVFSVAKTQIADAGANSKDQG